MSKSIAVLFLAFLVTTCGCAELRETSNKTMNLADEPSTSQAFVNTNNSSFLTTEMSLKKYDTRRPVIISIRMAGPIDDELAEYDLAKIERWYESPELSLDHLSDQEQISSVESEYITYKGMFLEQTTGILSDHKEFYSLSGLTWLAGGIGAGALMANTGFDENFVRDSYSENIVLAPSSEIYENLSRPKFLGDGFYTIPVFAIAALAEPLVADLPLGPGTAEWGQRSLRTILVGGPPVLGLQWLTGGGRPGETNESSEWRPLQDNNGVSGHSFMGAIPFISAAKMTDNIWLKGGLYVASTLPALSRVNDDAHYFSQAFLGWWLAYLAESAVDHSFRGDAPRRWHIYPSSHGMGVMLSRQW